MKTALVWSGVTLLLMVVVSSPVRADERTLQAALAKTQMMLRQAAADKVAADKQAAELKTELEKTRKEHEAYKKSTETRLQAKEQGSARLAQSVDVIKEQFLALQEKYAKLKKEYAGATMNSQTSDSQLKRSQENFQLCVENNRKLYAVNQEILGNYEDKGFWDVFKQKEPFTGLSAVEIENLVQDYQYKNDDLKVDESLLGVRQAN